MFKRASFLKASLIFFTLCVCDAVAPADSRRIACPSVAHYLNFNVSTPVDVGRWNPVTVDYSAPTFYANPARFDAVNKVLNLGHGGVANISAFDLGGGPISVSTWVQVNDASVDGARVWDFGSGPGVAGGFGPGDDATYNYLYLAIDSSIYGLAAGYGYYDAASTSAVQPYISVANVFAPSTLGTYTHIVATFDALGVFSIYVNGTIAGSRLNSLSVNSPVPYRKRTTAYIGNSQYNDLKTVELTNVFFNGSVADIGIYFETLNATTIAALYAGDLSMCSSYTETITFSNLTMTLANGNMGDLQIYNYNLVGGTDSCAPAPPPLPPSPPQPPSPPTPPPPPNAPPAVGLYDDIVAGTLKIYMDVASLYHVSSFGFQELVWSATALTTMIGLPLTPLAPYCLINGFEDAGVDSIGQPLALVGFTCKSSSTMSIADISNVLNLKIPALSASKTSSVVELWNSIGFNGAITQIEFVNGLFQSVSKLAPFPAAATTVLAQTSLYGANAVAEFDTNAQRAIAAAITSVLGLNSATAGVVVTGVSLGPVPYTVGVGIVVYETTLDLAVQAVDVLNNALPSPLNDVYNLELIEAVQAAGLPFVTGITSYANEIASIQALTPIAYNFNFITVQATVSMLASNFLSSFNLFGDAGLGGAFGDALGISAGSVVVSGVSPSYTALKVLQPYTVLIGLCFISNIKEQGLTNANSMSQKIASGTTIKTGVNEAGFPQITALSMAPGGTLQTVFPTVQSTTAFPAIATTIQFQAYFGITSTLALDEQYALVGWLYRLMSVPNSVYVANSNKIEYINDANVNATVINVGFIITPSSVANGSRAVNLLNTFKTGTTATFVNGLPQIKSYTVLGASLSQYDAVVTFGRPSSSVTIVVTSSQSDADFLSSFDESHRRAFEAGLAAACGTVPSAVSTSIPILTNDGMRMSVGVIGVTAGNTLVAIAPKTSSNTGNANFVKQVQSFGLPHITGLNTINGASTVLFTDSAFMNYQYGYSFTLTVNGIQDDAQERTALVAAVAGALGVGSTYVYMNSYAATVVANVSISTIGFTVSTASVLEAKSLYIQPTSVASFQTNIMNSLKTGGAPGITAISVVGTAPPLAAGSPSAQNAAITSSVTVIYSANVPDTVFNALPVQIALVSAIISRYNLPNDCCDFLDAVNTTVAGNSIVSLSIGSNVSSVITNIKQSFMTTSTSFFGTYGLPGITMTPTNALLYQEPTARYDFAVVQTFSFLTPNNQTATWTTGFSFGLLAQLCASLGAGAGCAGLTGADVSASGARVGVVFPAQTQTAANNLLNQIVSVTKDPVLVSDLTLNGFGFVSNVTADAAPLTYVAGTNALTPSSLSFSLTLPAMAASSLTDDFKAALVAGVSIQTGIPTASITINGVGVPNENVARRRHLTASTVAIGDPDLVVGFTMDTSSAALAAAAAAALKNSASFISTLKNHGLPQLSAVTVSTVLSSSVTVYKPGGFYSTIPIELVGTTADDFASDGAKLAFVGAVAQSVGVSPANVFITSTQISSKGYFQLNVAINGKDVANLFRSKFEADALSINILPSPGTSDLLIQNLNLGGLPQVASATLGAFPSPPPPPAPPAPPPLTGSNDPALLGTSISIAVVLCLVAAAVIILIYCTSLRSRNGTFGTPRTVLFSTGTARQKQSWFFSHKTTD